MITNEFICQNKVNGTANTLQYTKKVLKSQA
jgi:NAD-dependent DNA ligase